MLKEVREDNQAIVIASVIHEMDFSVNLVNKLILLDLNPIFVSY